MAKKKAKKRASTGGPAVALRFANPRRGGAMAKKKKTTHRKSPRRSNPKKRPHHRRRRNPNTFMERAGKLAGAGLIAVATGVVGTVAMTKLAPTVGSSVAEYGVPIALFGLGAAAYRTMPTLGAGMALGAFTPFVIPLASKLLNAVSPSSPSQAAAGIARSMRNMRAVSMGRMGAIDMGAVDMMGRAYA
jgi:hypothetical protein